MWRVQREESAYYAVRRGRTTISTLRQTHSDSVCIGLFDIVDNHLIDWTDAGLESKPQLLR